MAKRGQKRINPLYGVIVLVILAFIAAALFLQPRSRNPVITAPLQPTSTTAPTTQAFSPTPVLDTATPRPTTARPSATPPQREPAQVTSVPSTNRDSPPQPARVTAAPAINLESPPDAVVTPATSSRYYVSAKANARACPDTACQAVGVFQAGEYIDVEGMVEGVSVQGNTIWYRTIYLGHVVYVHTSLLIEASLVTQQVETNISTPPPGGGSPFGCNGMDDLNCPDFNAIGQNGNAHLAQCGDEDRLDRDGDGRACELD